jgi:hypothetical protein
MGQWITMSVKPSSACLPAKSTNASRDSSGRPRSGVKPTPSSGSYPASFPYAHTSALYDVTSGSNGSCGGSYLCTGTTGYDGPSGLGVPNGTTAFTG